MSPRTRKVLALAAIGAAIFCAGFLLSSGAADRLSDEVWSRFVTGVQLRLHHHIQTLPVDAKHYYLFPRGAYSIELFSRQLTVGGMLTVLFASIFHILFQPVFFCILTPQVVVNLALLPFFVYGIIRYFRKVWFLLAVFVLVAFQVGVYDANVEGLLRHGMICELIYLVVGSAGCMGWITKESY